MMVPEQQEQQQQQQKQQKQQQKQKQKGKRTPVDDPPFAPAGYCRFFLYDKANGCRFGSSCKYKHTAIRMARSTSFIYLDRFDRWRVSTMLEILPL